MSWFLQLKCSLCLGYLYAKGPLRVTNYVGYLGTSTFLMRQKALEKKLHFSENMAVRIWTFFFFALLWVTYMKLLLCGWRDLLDFIYFYRTSVILALPVQTICLINLKCSWTLLPLQINLCWALRKQVSV